MLKRVAFLGPKGTYAEQAAIALSELEGIRDPELIPCLGLRAVVECVAGKNSDAAVVPIENSVEGGVTASLDALWSHPELCIKRALVLPIRHALISSGKLAEISEVLSHPQALAQCSEWLRKNLPNALQLPTSSTADAVRMVSGSHFRAAIASRNKSNLKGLKELAFPINDVAGNCTRFVLLEHGTKPLKGEVCSIAFSLHSNAPGALLDALSCIAQSGLNMSRIESRPSKRELGEYIFFVDIELQQETTEIQKNLSSLLKPFCENIIYFGSYRNSKVNLD